MSVQDVHLFLNIIYVQKEGLVPVSAQMTITDQTYC